MTEAIDLTPEQQSILRALLRRFIPGVTVWAYGSRVRWTARPNSDLDLVAFATPAQRHQVAELKDALAESNLPFPVDLHVWDEVPQQFREIICKEYVVVQETKQPIRKKGMAGETHRLTLSDYFTLQRGTTYKSRLLGQPGPVLLGLATIQRNGGFRTDSLQTYGGDSPTKLLVQPGELYLSLKDVTQSADLLGAIARLPRNHPPGRLTQDTVKLEPKRTDVPLDYLYWLLRTPQYREYCRAYATGTTNLGLAREDFLAFPALQPTELQQRIVATLEALDDKIELNRRMNETLEAMARALFKSWFIDFDPVRAKAEGRDPGLPQPLADLFPDSFEESELREIPRGWDAATLSDLATLNPESWSNESRPEMIDYVDLSNTKWGRIEAVTSYSKGDAPSRAQRVLRPRDTIVGTVRPGNGSYALISADGLTGSTGFAVLRPNKGEYEEFVYLAASAPENIEHLAHLADGAAYPAVRPEVVATTQVVKPDAEVMRSFSLVVRSMLSKVAANEAETGTLAALRDTLLPKLISGEFRVRDAERFIERAI